MRIYVKIDTYNQIYDVYGAVICDNNDMLIRVKECGWNIVIRNVPTPTNVMNDLLLSGYADLSAYTAYFLQHNITTSTYSTTETDESERELDLFELEL